MYKAINGFLFLFLTAPALAAPSISSLTGTAAHNATMTVTGSNFTAISTVSYTRDDMESGSFASGWASTNDISIVTSSASSSNSTRVGTLNYTDVSVDRMEFQAPSTVSRKWYLSVKHMVSADFDWGTTGFDGNDKWLSNIKFPFRLWNPGSFVENFYFQYNGAINQLVKIRENLTPGYQETVMTNFRSSYSKGVWHKWDLEFIDSSAAGVADASYKLWLDGRLVNSASGETLKEDENVNKRPLIIGAENEWGPNENGGGGVDAGGYDGNNNAFLDDAYAVGGTVARVEVSTCATYAPCFRETQIVRQWSNTAINITQNFGALATGTTKYLYVVDDNGAVSSAFVLSSSTGSSNGAPSVNAGDDQTISLPDNTADLDATVSDDVGVLGSTWTVVSGPGGSFTDDNAVDTTYTASAAGTHVLQIAASDGEFEVTDTVTITVNAAPPAPGVFQSIKGRGSFRGGGTIRQ